MGRPKKEKKEKYWTAEVVEKEVKKILDAYPDVFPHFSLNDIQVLFKDGKKKEGKKHVFVKIIKEPITFVTKKKIIFMVVEGWWRDVIDSDKTKGIIEGLLSVESDDYGKLIKRPFDHVTFSEIAKGWSKFKIVLPGEKEDLVLG